MMSGVLAHGASLPPARFDGLIQRRSIEFMKLNLQPDSEAKLRTLADRSGVTPERYAEDVLAAHVGDYDRWFLAAVGKGFKDIAEGRVISLKQSKQNDEARRARLRIRKRRV